mmetsp:Transcript_82867/g.230545  ORF Transcript_82867/g.230545 Transcript_82867/m.230545 type:complete len:260 (-) Transcript_82867:143-922(-)
MALRLASFAEELLLHLGQAPIPQVLEMQRLRGLGLLRPRPLRLCQRHGRPWAPSLAPQRGHGALRVRGGEPHVLLRADGVPRHAPRLRGAAHLQIGVVDDDPTDDLGMATEPLADLDLRPPRRHLCDTAVERREAPRAQHVVHHLRAVAVLARPLVRQHDPRAAMSHDVLERLATRLREDLLAVEGVEHAVDVQEDHAQTRIGARGARRGNRFAWPAPGHGDRLPGGLLDLQRDPLRRQRLPQRLHQRLLNLRLARLHR